MRNQCQPTRTASHAVPSRARRTLCAVAIASLLTAGLLGMPAATALTSAEERLRRIKLDIVTLKTSVSRGDKMAVEKTASSIEQNLAQLNDEVRALPPLRLSVSEKTVILKYLGKRVSSTRLAGYLVTQAGISEDLAALQAQVVGQRRYRLSERQEVSVHYYPPGDVFVVQDIGGETEQAALDFLALFDRQQRFNSILARAINIETAWRKADPLTLAVRPPIARRLELDSDLLRVRYLHTGTVSPDGRARRSYDDLLREIQAQLEYIVNVKAEGPPLIATLRTGLFFDDELGFEAWGGRWPEFAGTVFFLRYSFARQEFLLTIERVAD